MEYNLNILQIKEMANQSHVDNVVGRFTLSEVSGARDLRFSWVAGKSLTIHGIILWSFQWSQWLIVLLRLVVVSSLFHRNFPHLLAQKWRCYKFSCWSFSTLFLRSFPWRQDLDLANFCLHSSFYKGREPCPLYFP